MREYLPTKHSYKISIQKHAFKVRSLHNIGCNRIFVMLSESLPQYIMFTTDNDLAGPTKNRA